jgi:hypothetical protein
MKRTVTLVSSAQRRLLVGLIGIGLVLFTVPAVKASFHEMQIWPPAQQEVAGQVLKINRGRLFPCGG